MEKFNFAVFDLDGTLLNTLEDLADAVNYALVKHDFPTHPYEDFNNFVGKGAYNLIEQVLPADSKDESTIERVLGVFSEYYSKNKAVKTAVYPGITQALQRITAAGYRIAVLSNKPDRYMEDIRKEYFSEIEFTAFRGKRDNVAIKPDPAGLQLLAEESGESLRKALYVGDSSVDIETAKNSNLFSCGVLWGFRTEAELTEYGADKLVATPDEMADFIIANKEI